MRKFRMKPTVIQQAVLAISLFGLISCASDSPKAAKSPQAVYEPRQAKVISGPTIYASLVNHDGKWEIGKIGTYAMQGVVLNNLQPTGYNLPKYCRKVAVASNLNSCRSIENQDFTSTSLQVGSAALGAVLTFGMSALAGDRSYDVKFDRPAFDKAVEMALRSSGLWEWERRKAFINRVEEINSWYPANSVAIGKVVDKSGLVQSQQIEHIKSEAESKLRFAFNDVRGSFDFELSGEANDPFQELEKKGALFHSRMLKNVGQFGSSTLSYGN